MPFQCGLRREFQMTRDETNHASLPLRMRQLRHLSLPLKGDHPLSPRDVCSYGLLEKRWKYHSNCDLEKITRFLLKIKVSTMTSRVL